MKLSEVLLIVPALISVYLTYSMCFVYWRGICNQNWLGYLVNLIPLIVVIIYFLIGFKKKEIQRHSRVFAALNWVALIVFNFLLAPMVFAIVPAP